MPIQIKYKKVVLIYAVSIYFFILYISKNVITLYAIKANDTEIMKVVLLCANKNAMITITVPYDENLSIFLDLFCICSSIT